MTDKLWHIYQTAYHESVNINKDGIFIDAYDLRPKQGIVCDS